MREAGGPGTGQVWQSLPSERLAEMTSAQWRVATGRRLHVLRRPLTAAGCNLRKHRGQICREPLDAELTHCELCNVGTVRHRPHRAMQVAIATEMKKAGAEVEIEAWIPELSRLGEDARMDLCIGWPGLAETAMWDVTVRAAARAGTGDASGTGVADKARRYGAAVAAIAISSRGRMHTTAVAAVAEMAARSRMWGKKEFGRPPGVRAARLRLAVEGAVVRALAEATLISLGASNKCVLGWKGSGACEITQAQAHAPGEGRAASGACAVVAPAGGAGGRAEVDGHAAAPTASSRQRLACGVRG